MTLENILEQVDKEKDDFEMEIEDGILKDCLVYHPAIINYFKDRITTAYYESRDKTCEEIMGLIGQAKIYTGGSSVNEKDHRINKTELLSKIKSLSKENLIKEEKEI